MSYKADKLKIIIYSLTVFTILGVYTMSMHGNFYYHHHRIPRNRIMISRTPPKNEQYHPLSEIWINPAYPINWKGVSFENISSIEVNGNIYLSNKVVINGSGGISKGLNADMVDGYHASDLLAASGGNGEYRIYYACSVATRCGGRTYPAWPSVHVPPCPPGWVEVYYRNGTYDPGYTYYPGFNIISYGLLTCQKKNNAPVTPVSGDVAECTVYIKDGSGTVIYSKTGKVSCGGGAAYVRVNCGYRICKKIA